jgi:hypothetical protein
VGWVGGRGRRRRPCSPKAPPPPRVIRLPPLEPLASPHSRACAVRDLCTPLPLRLALRPLSLEPPSLAPPTCSTRHRLAQFAAGVGQRSFAAARPTPRAQGAAMRCGAGSRRPAPGGRPLRPAACSAPSGPPPCRPPVLLGTRWLARVHRVHSGPGPPAQVTRLGQGSTPPLQGTARPVRSTRFIDPAPGRPDCSRTPLGFIGPAPGAGPL